MENSSKRVTSKYLRMSRKLVELWRSRARQSLDDRRTWPYGQTLHDIEEGLLALSQLMTKMVKAAEAAERRAEP
jgi:hypothetical protein